MSTTTSLLRLPENGRDALNLIGLVGLIAVPLVVSSYRTSIIATYLTFAILAISVDLVWGYTGMLTLGHAAFFGAGGYLTAKMLTVIPSVPSVLVVFVIAPLFTGILALAIGLFLFNSEIKGSYFAISMLIVAIVFENVAGEFVGFLGGFNGIYNIPSLSIGAVEFTARMNYYIALVMLLAVFLSARWIVNSAFGHALRGIRDNEERTRLFGYNTDRYRLIIFAISGVMAGIAGAMYVTIDGFVSPPLLGFVLSTQVVIWVAVGGRGTLIGAVIGALLIQYLNTTLSDLLLNFWELALAILFIAMVVFGSDGVVGLLSRVADDIESRGDLNE